MGRVANIPVVNGTINNVWDWLEQYLGLPETASGSETSWRVRWDRPWSGALPDWLGWTIVAALVIAVVLSMLREMRSVSRKGRIVLIGLRLSALAIAVLFLCRPVLSVNRTVEPVLAVLVDTSESMNLRDEYSDSAANERLAARIRAAGLSEPTRLNLALATLLERDGRFFKTLLRSHNVRVYQFAETASLLPGGELSSEEDLPALLQNLRALEPAGDVTSPAAAVRQVLEEMKGRPPSALIVFSDGVATGQSAVKQGRLSLAIDAARRERTALWTVGVGSSRPARDLELADVRVPDTAYRLDPLTFACAVKSTGYPPGVAGLRLSLLQDQTTLLEEEVILPAEGQTARTTLTWQPDRSGDVEFLVELIGPEDDVDPLNNRAIRKVHIRETPLRVLLADRVPRYEYRYLKEFLERESSVELESVLIDGDPRAALQDRSGQKLGGRFPVREDQIDSYDAIVLGDISPQELGPGVMQLLERFVSERGGALVSIAGSRFNPHTFRGTPLADLIPVALDDETVSLPQRWRIEGFRPRPTLAGLKGSPAFRDLGDRAAADISFWEQQGNWSRLFAFPTIKPGAVVWLETEPPGNNRPPLPLVVEHRFGEGKVLFLATDELWRLRYLTGDRDYGRFWLQTLRYLTRARSDGIDAELTSVRGVYERGEPVELRLRLASDQEDGPRPRPLIRIDGPQPVEIEPQPDPDLRELFTLSLPELPEGDYRAELIRPEVGYAVDTAFRVIAPLQETRNRALDEDELRAAAEQTGGRYTAVEAANDLAGRIPPGSILTLEALATLPLWNRWELLVLVLGLLTAEWLLRKRFQLA